MTDIFAHSDLPSYADLPLLGRGRSAWGQFGDDDIVGLINLQTPERITAAAGLVRRGAVFPLNTPLDMINPPMFGRELVRRTEIVSKDAIGLDDRLDSYYPQATAQWDALAHIRFGPEGFYNGASLEEVRQGRNTIVGWAQRGMAGRAVLLDLPAVLQQDYPNYCPGEAVAVSTSHLDAALAATGTSTQTADTLLLYTGYLDWYLAQPPEVRQECADRERLCAVGIEHTEKMAAWLWDHHVCAVATDAPGVEVWPPDRSEAAQPFGFLHQTLIGSFGMALGELWWLSDLARDCTADGVYEMFFTSAPLCIPGGVGSPPNALAIK